MATQFLTSESDWKALIKELSAVEVKLSRQPDWPKSAVYFETANFGWILSALDANGGRLIIGRF